MNHPTTPGNKPALSHWEFPDDASSSTQYLALLEQLQKLFIDIQRDTFSLPEFDTFVRTLVSAFGENCWGKNFFVDPGCHESTSTTSFSTIPFR